MASRDITSARVDDAVELGKENARIYTSVQDWCEHIRLDDISAGMIAEVYHLPMNTKISCPHTTGGISGMRLEDVATHFITDHCIGCTYHQEKKAGNFGAKAIAEFEAYKQQQIDRQKILAERRLSMKKEVQDLITTKKDEFTTTKLSVLALIEKLDEPEDKNVPELIFQAAQLKPQYFTSAAADFISSYIDNDNGVHLAGSLLLIQKAGVEFSDFTLSNVKEALKEGFGADSCIGILDSLIPDSDLISNTEFLEQVFFTCDYVRFPWMGREKNGDYPNGINVFKRLHRLDAEFFYKIFKTRILSDDPAIRININYIMIDFGDWHLLAPLIPDIIRSFELEEGDGSSSVDHQIRITLKEAYLVMPEDVIKNIENIIDRLNDAGRSEIVEFYERIITDDETFEKHPEYSGRVLENLMQLLLSIEKGPILKNQLPDSLETVTRAKPYLFEPHFEKLLGFLIETNNDLIQFKWFEDDLKNQEKPSVTFNPLIGKPYIDLHLEEMELSKRIREATSMLRHVVAINPTKFYPVISETISKLPSKKDGKLKGRMIELLRTSIKDPSIVAMLIPDIYAYIYDIDSIDVRYNGLLFVDIILSDFPAIAPQTLIDTIKIFLDDQDRLVKSRAIAACGGIISNFPTQFDHDSIEKIVKAVQDRYIIISKAAATLSYQIYPFLKGNQLAAWTRGLWVLEDYYFSENDFKNGQLLIDYLLFTTTNNEKAYSSVVTVILTKYCSNQDFYIATDAIKKLMAIAEQKPAFRQVWFTHGFDLLNKTAPSLYGSGDESREEIISAMYRMGAETIIANKSKLVEFFKNRLNIRFSRDLIEVASILAYFGLYEDLHFCATNALEKFPETAENDSIIHLMGEILKIADVELTVKNKKITKEFLAEINK